MDYWDQYQEDHRLDVCPQTQKNCFTHWNNDLASFICHIIAIDPRPLTVLCKEYKAFPSVITINNWRLSDPAFEQKFLISKRIQAHLLVDEIVEISDDFANCEPEVLAWAKEKIKTRQWLAKKLIPELYGDSQKTTIVLKHEESLKDLA